MEYSGLNSLNIKMTNRSEILRLLNNRGALSRKDIASELGLTPAAVTQITGSLLKSGLLREVGEAPEEKRVGRRKILLRMDENYAYILTICIEFDFTTMGIGNLRGDCIGRRRIRTEAGLNPEEFFKKLNHETKLLIWDKKLDQAHFLGLGVSMPGRVLRKKGQSQGAFPGWGTVKVQKILESYFDMPVIVENNVRAYAEAELSFGIGRQSENMFFVKWSPGVGSAVVIHNQIYENGSGQTSELGHVRIKRNGKLCHCGRRGCLETEISVAALVEKVRKSCTEEEMPLLYQYCEGKPERLREENFLDWCRIEEPKMQNIFKEAIELLVEGLAAANTSLIPDHLIYFGELFEIPEFREQFEAAYYAIMRPYCTEDFLVYSVLDKKIDYIGPLAIVYNERLLLKQGE